MKPLAEDQVQTNNSGGGGEFPALLIRARGARPKADLAHHVGVSSETIRRWESGLSTPRTPLIARALDEQLGVVSGEVVVAGVSGRCCQMTWGC